MMRKLDNRGVASFEMILVFVPLFTLMFVIFDLGRYAITQQSLNALAAAGARAVMLCYNVANNSYTGCTGDPLPTDAAKQAVAPFLYYAGLTPTLNASAGANTLTVTASQSGFTMLMPIWGTTLNAPSATTTLPF
jgi:Flp pilus assembly protein TadG